MVDKGRSTFPGVLLSLALIFAASFPATRIYPAGVTATAGQPAFIHHKKSHAKPLKPIPLRELPPVPIELGDSGTNPLTTFFDGLEKLNPVPAIPQPAPGGTANPPSTNPETPSVNPLDAPANPQRPATNPEPQTQTTPEAPTSQSPAAPEAAPAAAGQQPPVATPQPAAPTEPAPAEALQPQIVHIIHFGDSHVASDYWAGVLRERFQTRFGNAGPGFVLPGRPWPSIRYVEARSLDGLGWRTDGLRYTERDGVVGLGGMSLESYRELSPASAAATFSQFQVYAATSPGNSCFKVQVDDADVPSLNSQVEHIVPPETAAKPAALMPEPSPNALGGGAAAPMPPVVSSSKKKHKKRKVKHVSPDPPFNPWPAGSPLDLVEMQNTSPLSIGAHQLSVRSSCGNWGRLLGVELYNGYQGVVYDTDGVNGARLEDLEKPLPALRTALLKQEQPTLIIVSYGTNDIPMRGFDAHEYEERAFQILTKLKQDSGEASILVTGPTDRGSPRKRTRVLIQAGQAELQPALRKAALRAGCAFWDQQAAMGGPGSMTNWRRAGLANFDYVHFMGAGYQKLADMLYDQLMVEYANYHQAATPQQ
jgi:lysophospholipase L1-like esterase